MNVVNSKMVKANMDDAVAGDTEEGSLEAIMFSGQETAIAGGFWMRRWPMAHKIERYGRRNFALRDEQGALVVGTVYKKGAKEVARWLTELEAKLVKSEQKQ